jgi:hypothetical protein
VKTSNLLRALLWGVEALEARTEGQGGVRAARRPGIVLAVLCATVCLYAVAIYAHSHVLAVTSVVLAVMILAVHAVARVLSWPRRAVTLRRAYRGWMGIVEDN